MVDHQIIKGNMTDLQECLNLRLFLNKTKIFTDQNIPVNCLKVIFLNWTTNK
jgi:hypothetical protein